MKNPNSDQSFIGKTIHSELTASVPADKIQSVFPCITSHFLTNVWFCVAFETPATAQPEPGSPFQSPIKSRITYPPALGPTGDGGSEPYTKA